MLYYIHGYLSEPNSTKGLLFRRELDAKAIKYRNCEPEDLIIKDCLNRIEVEIKDDENVILIGSSLGGFLVAKTAQKNSNVKQIFLLNPAIIPGSYDIKKITGMPQRILSDIQDKDLFNKKLNCKIFILIGILDDVVPNSWVIEFARSQEAKVLFLHDDHSFSNKIDQLPSIIKEEIDKKIYPL